MSTKRAITQLLKDKERIEEKLKNINIYEHDEIAAVSEKCAAKRGDLDDKLRAIDEALKSLGHEENAENQRTPESHIEDVSHKKQGRL